MLRTVTKGCTYSNLWKVSKAHGLQWLSDWSYIRYFLITTATSVGSALSAGWAVLLLRPVPASLSSIGILYLSHVYILVHSLVTSNPGVTCVLITSCTGSINNHFSRTWVLYVRLSCASVGTCSSFCELHRNSTTKLYLVIGHVCLTLLTCINIEQVTYMCFNYFTHDTREHYIYSLKKVESSRLYIKQPKTICSDSVSKIQSCMLVYCFRDFNFGTWRFRSTEQGTLNAVSNVSLFP